MNEMLGRQELTGLCRSAHSMTEERKYETCMQMLSTAMARYPDAPEPHNLMGLVLECMGERVAAMKHFRAASALDPTYRPALQNLEAYGSVPMNGKPAWQDSDCGQEKKVEEEEYKDWNLGRFFRKVLCA